MVNVSDVFSRVSLPAAGLWWYLTLHMHPRVQVADGGMMITPSPATINVESLAAALRLSPDAVANLLVELARARLLTP